MADKAETPENRLKRLVMRSKRRGIREMDLILGAFADRHLAALSPEELDLYERFLGENDHDLYGWVTGYLQVPPEYLGLIERIRAGANLPGAGADISN